MYQPGAAGSPEFQGNRYSDATGLVSIPIGGLMDGQVFVTAMDVQGNSSPDTILYDDGQVTGVADRGPTHTLSFRALPTVMRAGTMFALGRPASHGARVDLYDAMGRRVRSLPIASGAINVRWDAADASGQHAASGVYLARYRDAEGEAKARVVVLQ